MALWFALKARADSCSLCKPLQKQLAKWVWRNLFACSLFTFELACLALLLDMVCRIIGEGRRRERKKKSATCRIEFGRLDKETDLRLPISLDTPQVKTFL